MPPTFTIPGTNGSNGVVRTPSVDRTKEYLAGGGTGYPLLGQLNLARETDDLARDLGPDIYRTMLRDASVAAAFNMLVAGVLAGKFQLVPAITAEPGEEVGDGDRAREIARAAEICDFCRRNVALLSRPVKQIARQFLRGMALGPKVGEKVWARGEGVDSGRLILKSLKVKPDRSWALVVDEFDEIIAVRGISGVSGYADYPREKFAIFCFAPTEEEPFGQRILRPVYNPWNLKVNTWPKYFKYLDKFGTPTVIGTAAPEAENEAEYDDEGNLTGNTITPTEAMFQMLRRLEGGSVAAIQNGASIQAFQAVAGGDGAFLHAFDVYKQEIYEALLLGARSIMEAKHGSRADSQTSQDNTGLAIGGIREELANFFEDEVFHPLIELNAGKAEADLYTPDVSFGRGGPEDKIGLITALPGIGYQIDASHAPVIDAMLDLPPREAGVDDGDVGPTSPEGGDGTDVPFPPRSNSTRSTKTMRKPSPSSSSP